MRRTLGEILKYLTGLCFVLFLLSVSALDSNNWIPILTLSFALLALIFCAVKSEG